MFLLKEWDRMLNTRQKINEQAVKADEKEEAASAQNTEPASEEARAGRRSRNRRA